MKKLCTGINLILLFFALMIAMGIYACNCGSSSCMRESWRFSITFRGISMSDVAPIILKRYAKGNTFTQLRDSTVLTGNDIMQLLEDNGSKTPMIEVIGNDSTDYEIVSGNQSVGVRHDSLTNLIFALHDCKTCQTTKAYHIYGLSGCRLNGVYQTSSITIQR